MAASHPYAAGSDAIQALFSPEKQAARLQPDASAFSLFVHLHGILYTGSDLDSFDATLARLEEKLEDTYTYAKSQAGRPAKRSVRGKQREDASQRLNRDSTWMMMAVINTCAVMEYGKEGGVLKRALAKAHDQKKSEKQSSRAEKKVLHQNRSDPTPSEASLTDLARQVERLGLEASKARASSSKRPELVPPLVSRTLRLALRFAFSLLRHTIRHPLKPGDIDPAICPYITILFTFLATLASNSAALAVIRSEVPWEEIIQFLESLPKYARDLYLCDKTTIPNRLLGITLPEDWCIRGLEWTGKQLFGRGYWKGKQGTAYMATSQAESLGDGNLGDLHAYSMPESEKDVLAERYEGPSMPAHAGGPQSSGVRTSEGIGLADDLDEDGEPPTDRETVARLRWKRVALTTAWLARAVPFILVDGDSGKVSLDRGLYDDMAEQDAQTAKRTSEATIDSTTPATSAQDNAQSIDSEPDEDGFLMGSGDESETVRELKARRRELKALLRQSRGDRNEETQQAFASRSADDELVKRPNRGKSVNALAGYTTLVFDTNVLLEAMDIFTALLTSKRWTLVVPLAVVTELDGLRSKEDPLGSSASQAIKFLEDAIKTYNLNLKIPTSKGNYLRDLNIRREDIDFGHSTSSGGNSGTTGKNNVGSKDSNSVKSMDDVILNVAIWQKTHWLDRRALLGIKPANTQETRSFTPVETILVSSDRTLRLKGKARGLEVCDAAAIQQLLEQPPNG